MHEPPKFELMLPTTRVRPICEHCGRDFTAEKYLTQHRSKCRGPPRNTAQPQLTLGSHLGFLTESRRQAAMEDGHPTAMMIDIEDREGQIGPRRVESRQELGPLNTEEAGQTEAPGPREEAPRPPRTGGGSAEGRAANPEPRPAATTAATTNIAAAATTTTTTSSPSRALPPTTTSTTGRAE